MATLTLRLGDCNQVMHTMPAHSVDAIVSDPPYGLEFMGKAWDKLDWQSGGGFSGPGIGDRETPWPSYTANTPFGSANPSCAQCGGRLRGAKKCSCDKPDWRVKGQPVDESHHVSVGQRQMLWHLQWAEQAYRILKPGGVIKAFCGTRTYHRMAAAMAEAGFEDMRLETFSYGSGFPKSKNIALFLDKLSGASGNRGRAIPTASLHLPGDGRYAVDGEKLTSNPVGPYVPVSDEARLWDGWGTALKPAWEPVVIARKPR
jgi:DNA modification methylase